MASFAIKNGWDRGGVEKVQRITLEWLQRRGPETLHHEPPKFLGGGGVVFPLDHATHALFHRQRYIMYGRQEDLRASIIQEKAMNGREARWEALLQRSPDVLEMIRGEIRRRAEGK